MLVMIWPCEMRYSATMICEGDEAHAVAASYYLSNINEGERRTAYPGTVSAMHLRLIWILLCSQQTCKATHFQGEKRASHAFACVLHPTRVFCAFDKHEAWKMVRFLQLHSQEMLASARSSLMIQDTLASIVHFTCCTTSDVEVDEAFEKGVSIIEAC